jgi:hypothetical protein
VVGGVLVATGVLAAVAVAVGGTGVLVATDVLVAVGVLVDVAVKVAVLVGVEVGVTVAEALIPLSIACTRFPTRSYVYWKDESNSTLLCAFVIESRLLAAS